VKGGGCSLAQAMQIFLFACGMAVILCAIEFVALGKPSLGSVLDTFILMMTCSFFCALLLCQVFGFIILLPRPMFILLFLGSIAVGVVLGNILGGLILIGRPWLGKQTLVISLVIGIFMGSTFSFYIHLRDKLERRIAALKNVEIENERLKRIDSELRLQGLQSKLDPHFLFNTLNSVAALIYEDPRRAEQGLVRLANLYRKVLSASNQTWIELDEEIELLRDYLELVRLRFDERLDYTLECPDGLRRKRIPGLLLQPLVENAVKQAENLTEGEIRVRVSAEESGGEIIFRIADDGPGFDVERTAPGFGLYSVQERLRLAYGEVFGLTIRSAEGRGTDVIIRIPAEEGRKEAAEP